MSTASTRIAWLLGGGVKRLLLISLASTVFVYAGTGQAQYGYNQQYGNPGGYPGYVDPIEQQMAALQQQIDAQLLVLLQPFIKYYRESTGDWQTPDALAGQYGMNLWCTNFPVECQRAHNTTSPEAAAWMAQSAAAHQQNMAQRQAGFDSYMQGVNSVGAAQDAAYQSWLNGQNASYAANQAWIQGVIWGEGNYTNPVTGATMSLPFAPAPGTIYQSPGGNQMYFDPSTNSWREVGGGGVFQGQ